MLLKTYKNKIFLLNVKRPFKKAALVKETSLQTSVLIVLVKGVSKKKLLAYKVFKGLVKIINIKVEVGCHELSQ